MRALSQRELSLHENRAGALLRRIAGELPAEYPQGAGAAGVTVLNQGVLLNPLRDGSPESAVQPYAAIAPADGA
jgi:hypothetical protein